MKEPKVIIWSLRQCAEMLDSKQREMDVIHKVFTKPGELWPEIEKRITEYENKLRIAVKDEQLEGITEYEDEELVFNTKHFYDWAKENDFTFGDAVEDMLQDNIDKMEEEFLLWDFQQRHRKNCKRKIEDDKLALALLEPLWILHEGLISLDGFVPSGDNDLDMKCLRLDKRLSRLHKCAIDANEIKQLELVKEKGFWSLTYKVRPTDLVKWLTGMGEKLQLLPKAVTLIKIPKNAENHKYKKGQVIDINPKEKSSLLKIIYSLAHKHYKYDPSQEKNADISKIHKLIEQTGFTINRKTIKKVIDEAYEYANLEIEN